MTTEAGKAPVTTDPQEGPVAARGAVTGVDHVQLAMPPGAEADAVAFYAGLLGLEPVPKPPELAGRGGCWFRAGATGVHLGVEEPFRPARKAHPAFVVADLDVLVTRLERGGHRFTPDAALPGVVRGFVDDPFGNRVELVAAS